VGHSQDAPAAGRRRSTWPPQHRSRRSPAAATGDRLILQAAVRRAISAFDNPSTASNTSPPGTPTRPGSSSTAASPPTGDDHPHAEPATQQPTHSLSPTTHREQTFCARDTSCKIRRISAQPSDDHRCRLARPSIVLLTDTAASSQPDGVRRREGGIDAVIVPVAFCSSQSASTHQQCLLHAQMQRRQEPPPAVIALVLAGSMCPPREPAHPPARQPRALRRHLTR
jgi:hypothetical protein